MTDSDAAMVVQSPLPTLMVDPVSGGLHCRCPDVCLPSGRYHYDLYLLDPTKYQRKVEEPDRLSTAYCELAQELSELHHRLTIEQSRLDDLCRRHRSALDEIDSIKNQCQAAEHECTELNSKVLQLEGTVESLSAQISSLKSHGSEPKRKKTFHSSSSPASSSTSFSALSTLSSAVSTSNVVADIVATKASSYIHLPVNHIHELFTWVCLHSTTQSIQKTIHFINPTLCSTSSMLGASWVHRLIPPFPNPVSLLSMNGITIYSSSFTSPYASWPVWKINSVRDVFITTSLLPSFLVYSTSNTSSLLLILISSTRSWL
jgi:predicted  nucleic acid-binding Zn-ribbon protein